MSQVNANGATKRGAPDIPTQDAERRITSDQVYRNLLGQVRSAKVLDAPEVLHLFGQIAGPGEHGIEKPEESDARVQQAFSTLIEHHEFALFAEAFQRYSEGRRKFAEYVGEAFVPSLVLCLPGGWQVDDGAAIAMGEAFATLGLENLTVLEPMYAGGDVPPAVSEGACLCVQQLLLKAGVVRLKIAARLEASKLVADAFASCHLQSLSLSSGHLPRLEQWKGYERLCAEIWRCRQLTHLTIHLGLEQAGAVLASLCQKDAPAISSLNLSLGQVWLRSGLGMSVPLEQAPQYEKVQQEHEQEEPWEDQPDLVDGVKGALDQIAKMRALVELSLEVPQNDGDDNPLLPTAILDPLKEHESLHTLRIVQDGFVLGEGPEGSPLLELIAFSNTCPALTALTWTHADPLYESDVKKIFNAADWKHSDPEVAQRLAKALESCKLRVLIFGGSVVSKDMLATFLRVLREGALPMESVDFKLCILELDAMRDAYEVLEENRRILKFGIPDEPTSYYLLAGDAHAYTFEGQKGMFSLEVEGGNADAAHAAFEPLKEFANSFLTRIPAMVARNRREAITPEAVYSMTSTLAEVLSKSQVARSSRLDASDFSDVAQVILKQLADSGEFPSAARLPRVAKTQNDPSRQGNKNASVRELVKADLDNKWNARKRERQARYEEAKSLSDALHAKRVRTLDGYARADDLEDGGEEEARLNWACAAIAAGDVDRLLDLIDDGLQLNTVNTVGYNMLLDAAVTSGRADMLRILLQSGAEDLDWMVQRRLMPVHLREVFTSNRPDGTATRTHTAAADANDASTSEAEERLHDAALAAIAAGDLEALSAALDAGAPVDLTDPESNRPDANMLLVAAVEAGRVDMVRLLIAKDAEDYFGLAALQAQTPEMIDALDGA